jgi:hypothetical protein
MKVISGVYHGVTTIQLDDLVRHWNASLMSSGTDNYRRPRQRHT